MAKNFTDFVTDRTAIHNAAYADEFEHVSTVENTEKAGRSLARADWRKAIRSGLAKDHTERLNSVFASE